MCVELHLCSGNVIGLEINDAGINSRGERWLPPRDQADADRRPDDRGGTVVVCGQPAGGLFLAFNVEDCSVFNLYLYLLLAKCPGDTSRQCAWSQSSC